MIRLTIEVEDTPDGTEVRIVPDAKAQVASRSECEAAGRIMKGIQATVENFPGGETIQPVEYSISQPIGRG